MPTTTTKRRSAGARSKKSASSKTSRRSRSTGPRPVEDMTQEEITAEINTLMPTFPTRDPREIAAAIADEVRDAEAYMETERTLPPALVDRMWETGCFSTLVPKVSGGLEYSVEEFVELVEETSRLSGAVGWCVMNQGGFFTGWWDPARFLTELREHGRIIHAASFGRVGGKAVKVDGGYEVEAEWGWLSGSPHATHIGGLLILHDEDDTPVIHDDGLPWMVPTLVTADKVELKYNWDGLGIRGTGSHDATLPKQFVPDSCVNYLGFHDRTYDFGTFRLPMAALMGHGAHGIGLAQAALDSMLDEMKRKASFGSQRQMVLGKEQIHQIDYAQADAIVKSSRCYLRDVARRAFDSVETDSVAPVEMLAEMRQAWVYTKHASKDAVDLVQGITGVATVRKGTALERIVRDMTTSAQALPAARVELASVGALMLTKDLPFGPIQVGRPFF